MKKNKRSLNIFLVLSLFLFNTSSTIFGMQNDKEENSDQRLLYVFSGAKGWKNHHPFTIKKSDKEAVYLNYFVSRPLFTLDAKSMWACKLCRVFPSLENKLIEMNTNKLQDSPMMMKLTLNENYKWGDGAEITGNDLNFTWKVASKIEGDFIGKGFYGKINKIYIDPKNKRELTIYFKDKNYLFLDWQHVFLLPSHLEEELWVKAESDINQYLRNSLYLKKPETPGLYSGSFCLTTKTNMNSTVLASNYKSHRSKAKLHELAISAYSSAQVNLLKGQRVVLSENIFEHKKNINDSLVNKFSSQNIEVFADSNRYEQVLMNHRNPILRDKRVRRALAHAVDKEEILAQEDYNTFIPANNFLYSKHPSFSADISFYAFDLELSAKLLDNTAWKLNPKDRLRYKNGEVMKLTLHTNRSRLRMKNAKKLIKNWRKIGVDVELIVQDSHTFFFNTIERINYEGLSLFAWDLPSHGSLQYFFSSKAIPNIHNRYLGQNLGAWKNNRVDQIISFLKTEFEEKKRDKHLKELQKIYSEEIPSIPLFFYLEKAYIPRDLKEFSIPVGGLPSSLTASSWAF